MSRTKAIAATIERPSAGGFVAVASTASRDRDGEVLAYGAFNPLPNSVPCHVDHVMTAAGVVGRGRPYYSGDKLYVDVALASTADAQVVRDKLREGILTTVSIAFMGQQWETIAGQRTLIKGELLAVDLVSVPANRDATVVSVRGYPASPVATLTDAHQALADLELSLMRFDLDQVQRFIDELDAPAPLTDWALAQVEAWRREQR
jgi:HK97 family phage prohead protease